MQAVGHDFKMHEQFRRSPGSARRVLGSSTARRVLHAVEEKLQDAHRNIHLQVERAIHKFKVACAALVQRFHLGHEAVQLKRPGGFVQRTEAKLAFERAAARGFDVEQALGQILRRVFAIRQRQFGQRRLLAGDDFHQRRRAVEQGAAQFGKAHIAPAGDDVVGQAADFLLAGFKANFRPAEHDFDVRAQGFQQTHQLRRFDHIPDIHAQADHAGIQRQQLFGNLNRALADGEFAQLRQGAQAGAAVQIHVRQQAAQAERGVNKFGVQRD